MDRNHWRRNHRYKKNTRMTEPIVGQMQCPGSIYSFMSHNGGSGVTSSSSGSNTSSATNVVGMSASNTQGGSVWSESTGKKFKGKGDGCRIVGTSGFVSNWARPSFDERPGHSQHQHNHSGRRAYNKKEYDYEQEKMQRWRNDEHFLHGNARQSPRGHWRINSRFQCDHQESYRQYRPTSRTGSDSFRSGYSKKSRKGKYNHRSPTSSTASASKMRDVPSTNQQKNGDGCNGAKLELPGYYYNAERKRYYKIQPDHRGFDGSIITSKNIAREKAEEQRQKDVAANNSSGYVAVSASKRSINLKKSLSIPSVSNVLLNGSYQRGEVDKFRLQQVSVVNCASRLRHCNTRRVFSDQPFHENLEHMLQMETSTDHDNLLCLWSVAGTMVERLQLVNIREGKRLYPGEFTLEFSSCSTVLQSWNKITSMCWSDFSQNAGKKYVLYTTMCRSGQTQSLAFIRNLDPTTQEQVHFFDFNLGTHTSWTCAWNFHKQQFGVGTEKGCMVVDVNTRRLWQFKTNNSDVIAQIFTKEDGGSLMYTGARNGSILKHDLRSSSNIPVRLMNHTAAVCCLRLSHDEQYLYASDFSGKIQKWDLRMRRSVLCYEGLLNKHSKLPFYIDETQSILYAAGQDCYAKLWCLNSGHLLKSIPPPYEASIHTIPAIQYSSRWVNMAGNMGLIMGAQKSFYLYGENAGSA